MPGAVKGAPGTESNLCRRTGMCSIPCHALLENISDTSDKISTEERGIESFLSAIFFPEVLCQSYKSHRKKKKSS